jgi:hypothetical protein
MAMTSMNVSLPEELKEYVEAQTKRGYSTPSEYVRELIGTIKSGEPRKGSMPYCWKGSTPVILFRWIPNFGVISSKRLSPSWNPARRLRGYSRE